MIYTYIILIYTGIFAGFRAARLDARMEEHSAQGQGDHPVGQFQQLLVSISRGVYLYMVYT